MNFLKLWPRVFTAFIKHGSKEKLRTKTTVANVIRAIIIPHYNYSVITSLCAQ